MDAGSTAKTGDDPTQSNPQAKASEKQAVPAAVEIEDAPDPDEDDLDDLDDMLDEFSSVKLNSNKAAAQTEPTIPSAATSAPAPAPSLPAAGAGSGFTADGLEDLSEEDFEKQLQAGMAELMNDLETSASLISSAREISESN